MRDIPLAIYRGIYDSVNAITWQNFDIPAFVSKYSGGVISQGMRIMVSSEGVVVIRKLDTDGKSSEYFTHIESSESLKYFSDIVKELKKIKRGEPMK